MQGEEEDIEALAAQGAPRRRHGGTLGVRAVASGDEKSGDCAPSVVAA